MPLRPPGAALLLVVATPRLVSAHGGIVSPPSRNAVDRDLPPWDGPVPVSPDGAVAFDPWCAVPSADSPRTPAGKLSGSNGQACFWFSSGCSIGCKECDGWSRGPIPSRSCADPNDPHEMCARKYPTCDDGLKMPTLPKEARTVNMDKADGSADDYYQYSPWRSPGSAGVIDACGVAGGWHGARPNSPFNIYFVNTSRAHVGMHGSQLPPRDTGTVWRAGDVVEVSWTVNANHGGGYYWRLCKLPEDGSPVTEECFQNTPLVFIGDTRFRWDGDPATEEAIDNVFVDAGTTPRGALWAMNPVPRNDSHQTGASFAPKCKETCSNCMGGRGGACAQCRCTGEYGPSNLEIVDRVALPWLLPAGKYVLGWRWDAEESNQVWNGCSDVTIVTWDSEPPSPPQPQPSVEEELHGDTFGRVPCPLPDGLCVGDEEMARRRRLGGGGKPGLPLPLNTTLEYVRELLQQAIEVEHSTVPLYLTALWSMRNGSAAAGALIHSVAVEEMLHMTVAANALNAVGGAPMIDAPGFIPSFPMYLPMTNVSVGIERLSRAQVSNFMLIESITSLGKSIGAAYEYVLSILQALCDQYGEDQVFTGNYSYQIEATAWVGPQGTPQTAPKIANLSDAATALLGVSEQGGGCPVPGYESWWPLAANQSAGPLVGGECYGLSHYARFFEIHAEREWRANDTAKKGPTGTAEPVDWEGAASFKPNPSVDDFEEGTDAHAVSLAFASNYTALLVKLHDAFNGAPEQYFPTLNQMHALTVDAQAVLRTRDPRNASLAVGPSWEYIPAASQYYERGGRARPTV